MILVIDNYDSFTFNVIQYLATVTDEEIKVVRNDQYTVEQLAQMNPSRLIVSPGPGAPHHAGICEQAIKYFAGKIPILGFVLVTRQSAKPLGHALFRQSTSVTELLKISASMARDFSA